VTSEVTTRAGAGALRVLVMAKAPVPGVSKTRLAASIGDDAAAEVAAAALIDTLAAAAEAVGSAACVLALAGDLDDGAATAELRAALTGWTVLPQRGDGFDERLANAHHDAGDGPVLQVGMDTPQMTAAHLHAAGSVLETHDTVLGAAEDGGWWVLGRRDAAAAEALRGVEMSTSTTYDDTREALLGRGLSVAPTAVLNDVDEYADAVAVAQQAPHTRFARTWAAAASLAAGAGR
jgi:rSAM/selenodomain-associated transferase 1